MRIGAQSGKGKFGHICAADDDKTGSFQTRHNNRVGSCRYGIFQHN